MSAHRDRRRLLVAGALGCGARCRWHRAVAPAAAYDWPGNVRELQNVVERALIVSRGGPLDAVLPAGAPSPGIAAATGDLLEEIERAHLQRVLEGKRWVIQGEAGAARALGLNPSTLRHRLRKLGLAKPR